MHTRSSKPVSQSLDNCSDFGEVDDLDDEAEPGLSPALSRKKKRRRDAGRSCSTEVMQWASAQGEWLKKVEYDRAAEVRDMHKKNMQCFTQLIDMINSLKN